MSKTLSYCYALIAICGLAVPASAQDTLVSWAELANRTEMLEAEVNYISCQSCNTPGWQFDLDSVLWSLERRGSDYAIATDNTALAVGSGNVQHLDYDWDLGGRVKAGYNTAAGWNFGFAWTYFQTDATDSIVEPAGGNLWATRSHPDRNEQASSASAATDFELNIFDFETRYAFLPNESLAIELVSGLRWANVQDDLRVLYDGRDFNNAEVTNLLEMTGFGARFGGEVHWRLNDCWSFFGGGSGSILYGRFDRESRETNTAGADVIVNISDSYARPVTVMEASVGITRSWNDRISFRGGYEAAGWMGLGDRALFADNEHEGLYAPMSEDILMHGGFGRFTIVF